MTNVVSVTAVLSQFPAFGHQSLASFFLAITTLVVRGGETAIIATYSSTLVSLTLSLSPFIGQTRERETVGSRENSWLQSEREREERERERRRERERERERELGEREQGSFSWFRVCPNVRVTFCHFIFVPSLRYAWLVCLGKLKSRLCWVQFLQFYMFCFGPEREVLSSYDDLPLDWLRVDLRPTWQSRQAESHLGRKRTAMIAVEEGEIPLGCLTKRRGKGQVGPGQRGKEWKSQKLRKIWENWVHTWLQQLKFSNQSKFEVSPPSLGVSNLDFIFLPLCLVSHNRASLSSPSSTAESSAVHVRWTSARSKSKGRSS